MTFTRTMVLTVLAAALAATPAAAQDGHFGVKGGLALASQSDSGGSDPGTLDWRSGPAVGGFVRMPLIGALALQAEAQYIRKGGALSVFGISSSLHLDYLEVPILGRMRFGAGHTSYFVAAGVAPAFRLRAVSRTRFAASTEEIDVSDQLDRFDLGIGAGGGVVLGRIEAEVRYTAGIHDVDRDKSDSVRTKNRAFTVTAGYRF